MGSNATLSASASVAQGVAVFFEIAPKMPLNRDRASAAQPPILKSFDSVTDAPRKAIVGLKGELPDALLVSPNHSKQGDGLGGKHRIASLGFQLPHLLR